MFIDCGQDRSGLVEVAQEQNQRQKQYCVPEQDHLNCDFENANGNHAEERVVFLCIILLMALIRLITFCIDALKIIRP